MIKDAFYYYLWNKFNFINKEEFDKNYDAIKLGYLLAILDDEKEAN